MGKSLRDSVPKPKTKKEALSRVLDSKLAHAIFYQIAFEGKPIRLTELGARTNKALPNLNEYLFYLVRAGFVKREKISGVHVEYSANWERVIEEYRDNALHYFHGDEEKDGRALVEKICANPEFKRIFERMFTVPSFGPGRTHETTWGSFREYFSAWKFRIIIPFYMHYKDTEARTGRPRARELYKDFLKLGEIYFSMGDLGKGVHELLSEE